MPEPTIPTSAKLYTRHNWIFIPTIASATLAPTVAEATAASALDFSNMVFAGGQPQPTQNTNLVDKARRFAEGATFQFVGTTTYTGGEIRGQFNQQGTALADDVKLWEKFAAGGVTGFLAERMNVPRATNLIAGQFLNVFPAEFGPGLPVAEGDGEGSEGAMVFSWAITSQPKFKLAILA